MLVNIAQARFFRVLRSARTDCGNCAFVFSSTTQDSDTGAPQNFGLTCRG
jgi:hypothetical protein